MVGNGGASSTRNGGASITAAATAIGSADTRFRPPERQRRWGGCLAHLSCFGYQKRGKRIVPATRIPDGSPSANRANGPQPTGLPNQTTTITPSLLAPPSSPASFTNSALPSTAQSPSCFLSMSANSPGGPSNMFATGPYAHETQLVSPPVFSTFTTEPSTAPLTPPPELAHLTTPSSPDVPFAQFLSSSVDLKTSGKENGIPFMSSSYAGATDLQATYPLYPGSPASSLISPMSGTSGDGLSSSFHDNEFPGQWGASVSGHDTPYPRNRSSKLFALDSASSNNFMLSQDSSFFCPATSAQFYLDQAQQTYPAYAHCGGRLSLSRESDAYSNGGNTHQGRHSKACIADAEEIEAYRASFGFSADEIITTPQYVEISDVMDDSFTMTPFPSNNPSVEERLSSDMTVDGEKMTKLGAAQSNSFNTKDGILETSNCVKVDKEEAKSLADACYASKGPESTKNDSSMDLRVSEADLISKIGDIKIKRSRSSGLSMSDAEIDYRKGRSRREGNRDLVWC
ncbi:hypothetical protein H6P81_000043 [Aristolochia fimbriata]|uniref:Hydroxyproline-rich glycoprotein family protein n=1 Tax=Aristolochia fimbriata TaxID=158543 RepID=A0AAV7F302_ARIFI|nr:hypothetical protein H6P81_000043 [Aristolochia fimbriata]